MRAAVRNKTRYKSLVYESPPTCCSCYLEAARDLNLSEPPRQHSQAFRYGAPTHGDDTATPHGTRRYRGEAGSVRGGGEASALPGISSDAHSEVVTEKGISSSQAGDEPGARTVNVAVQ